MYKLKETIHKDYLLLFNLKGNISNKIKPFSKAFDLIPFLLNNDNHIIAVFNKYRNKTFKSISKNTNYWYDYLSTNRNIDIDTLFNIAREEYWDKVSFKKISRKKFKENFHSISSK